MRKKIWLLIPVFTALCFCLAMKRDALPQLKTDACRSVKQLKTNTAASEVYLPVRLPSPQNFQYYSQVDPRWKDYLYGGRDPMAKYGCGPTVLAMLVSSLTQECVTPVDMAQWAAANGCFSPGGGSRHNLIPDGCAAFGLKVESLNIHTAEALTMPLYYHKLIVLLMGPGHFTQKGHFIILTGVDKNGRITVADPFNADNSSISWPAQLLLDELSGKASSGGPIWVISAPEGEKPVSGHLP